MLTPHTRLLAWAACLCAPLLAPGQPSDAPAGLAYSGQSRWNPADGTLAFVTSGAMPDGKESFFWQVPPDVRRIVIGSNVVVRGGFRVLPRADGNALLIAGAERNTSVLWGTDEEQWTVRNGVADNAKWRYGAVCLLGDATVRIEGLTSRNPRGYHFSGYAPKAVLHVARCNILDTRPGSQNNSDGFVGAAGSTLADTFISTGDDAVKVYHDLSVRNVVIEQHRNGAPLQLGWGGAGDEVRADIENLTIRGASPDGRYNMAPISWEGGSRGTRRLTIRGLSVAVAGSVYDEEAKAWRPLGLFELKPTGCAVDIAITGASLGGLGLGDWRTPGTIVLNGQATTRPR